MIGIVGDEGVLRCRTLFRCEISVAQVALYADCIDKRDFVFLFLPVSNEVDIGITGGHGERVIVNVGRLSRNPPDKSGALLE